MFRSHMEPNPILRTLGKAGTRFAGVFDGMVKSADLYEATWCGSGRTLVFLHPVPKGRFTIYDALVVDEDLGMLAIDQNTMNVPNEGFSTFQFRLKELCVGMGGIGMGIGPLHGQVVAVLDHNGLACKHLELNKQSNVLQRDLCDDTAKGEFHLLGGAVPILTSGFPCQPHSTQGLQKGSQDSRHHVFTETLRTAYLHDVLCLILECTPQAQHDIGLRKELECFASLMGFSIHETTLALSHQWPCRRHRWWAILCPAQWGRDRLLKWPSSKEHEKISSILPDWGTWPDAHEEMLQLSTVEISKYGDSVYGNDKRLLELDDMAPTFLHSYGNGLSSCPCECRLQPFSELALQQKGLRGCFVISEKTHMPRLLHPRELFALHGIPQTVLHLSDLRAALCLIGQVASPLQSLWVFSCLDSMIRGENDESTLQLAMNRISHFKILLIRDHFHLWQREPRVPRSLKLTGPDGTQVTILTAGCITVAQLIRAETFKLEHGELLHVLDGPRLLPVDQHLLEQGEFGPYQLISMQDPLPEQPYARVMIGILHNEDVRVAMIRPGDFLFQALQQCGLHGIHHLEDDRGLYYGLDFRAWGSLRLWAIEGVFDFPRGNLCKPWDNQLVGLGSRTIWSSMTSLIQSALGHYADSPLMLTPELAKLALAEQLDSKQKIGLSELHFRSNGDIFCIFAARNHWALLCGTSEGSAMTWTYFDGLRNHLQVEASCLAWNLCQYLQLSFAGFESFSLQPQTLPHTCGTIALMHLCLALGLSGHFLLRDELRLHNLLLSMQTKTPQFQALGWTSGSLPDSLVAFLIDKGVPEAAALQRAQDAIRTLGVSSIQEALASKNPWAALKALASRPSSRFRWVKEDELKAHVAQQARSKHGAAINKAKSKKTFSKNTTALPPIDPCTLRLVSGTFVDDNDVDVPQLSFEDVGQDAHGLAFCNLQAAMPFLEAATSISTEALGLLITTEVPADLHGMADVKPLRFPAVCTVTDEPLLLQGALLTLGDMAIMRKESKGPKLITCPTSIIKVQIFQDEIPVAWSEITKGPIRGLLQLVPYLRVCAGKSCGKDCPLFHPPVGETMTAVIVDVWSRNFCNSQGRMTKPDQAFYFQAMIRVPTLVLKGLVQQIIRGVYLEPRADEHTGPHPDYSVVWLTSHSRDQALHKLRTASHGLSLARQHQRYGIRVESINEKDLHEEVKPDDTFVDLKIKQVYTIFPVPFGLQKNQLAKLFAAWNWKARPLQPAKGNLQGQAWTVGAEDPPPQQVMRAFDQDVLITLQKEVKTTHVDQPLVASQRTKKFLKEGGQSSSSTGDDPWWQQQNGAHDPWGGWRSTNPPASVVTASRASQIQQTIKDEVQKHIVPSASASSDPTVAQMEVNIKELQAQGTQFKQWFHEAGQRLTQTEKQMTQLQGVVEQQGAVVSQQIQQIQQEVDNKTQILQSTLQGGMQSLQRDLDVTLESKLDAQFSKFESLLSKSRRTEWLSHSRCRHSTGGMRGNFLWIFFTTFMWPWVWAEGLQVPSKHSSLLHPGNVGFTTVASSACSLHDSSATMVAGHLLSGFRIGEAANPGPVFQDFEPIQVDPPAEGTVRIGISNPSGLRGKEMAALSLGCGIWCFSETHLSMVTQRSTSTSLKAHAAALSRQVRTHFGGPVQFRANSDVAGTWSGVGIISDFASQELRFPWNSGERTSGRAMVCRHQVGSLPLTTGVAYGYPAGPTWPQSRKLTNDLLCCLTRDVVLGSTGPRMILGDFNKDIAHLDECRQWERLGWVEAQVMASHQWNRPISATCKNATVVDFIWLSPEAAALCVSVGVQAVFTEHLTLFVDLAVPAQTSWISTWPRPTAIPWAQVDLEGWQQWWQQQPFPTFHGGSSTEFYSTWARTWEQSLQGWIQDAPHGRLPPHTTGRAERTAPMKTEEVGPICKPSRAGEVQLKGDIVSTQVHRWFKQLRRLQSLKHAALANNDSLNAQSYRLCLWTAIKEANGFAIDFPSWWRTRRHQLPSAPDALPAAPPDGPQACIIFEDFKLNFEKFELWHLRQRGKILRDKHVHGMQQLFKELKPPQRDQIDLLWQNHDFTIMAIDFDTCQIDVDRPPPTIGQITWKIGSKELQHTNMVGTVLTFASLPDDLEPMDLLQCHQAFASSADLHAALLELWQPRWQKTSLVGGSEWARIVAFIEAYMPKMHFPAPTFDLQSWKSVLKRFPTRPARGVDGVSVEDLSHLPDVASQSLLDFLQRIDGVNTDWPEQLKYGTVISLSKRDDPHLAQHYRPVVILSCVYRAWARLWAQPLLHTLANLVPGNACGFLPGRECAQVWIQLQGIIEVCLQQGISFSGFSTDIEKCFNNVGRDSLMKLAVHVGFPQRLLQAWRSFLDSFKRAFVVRTAHSEAIQSTQGLPEGCSMSVVGMVLIDWMLHTYLAALTPSVHAYSYVDNVSVAGHLTMEVVAAFFSTICFFELWGLSLDAGKTYFWSTHPKERALLQLLGLSLKSDAIELGGSMSFEAGRRNRLLKSRGASLLPKWQRLKRSVAPMACKLGALSSVFWPAALHGSPACQLPQSYFHALRQEANKALRCNQAGSNAKLRLSLADQAVADPGYYHLTSVIRTFRRVCGKSPVVLDCWRLWFSETTIEPTAGPFGVLLSALNDVGWQLLAPPLVVDHCGFEHDLLLAPLSLLLHLLDEAWLLKISHEVRERKTMNELFGIDRCTSQHGHAGLTAHERSLVSALQSGSFIDKWTHGRYDLTKDRLCSSCGIPETQDHLIVCPRF